MAEHTYKGRMVRPCLAADPKTHGGRWFLVIDEQPGTPRFEDQSPHFATLAQAKAAIDEARAGA